MKKLFYACLFFGFVLLAVSCSDSGSEKETDKFVSVKVMPVKSERGIRSSSYVGSVIPLKSAVLSCRYPGTLTGLYVSQGDYVEKGQVLAQVESSSVESAYKMARATLEQAEDGYGRVMQVYGTGSIPDVKRVEVEAQLSKARAAAEAASRSLEDCKIKAPFAGVVGEVYCDRGVELSLLDPIAKVMDISDVEIRFPVPEKEIGRLRVGDTAYLVVPALKDSAFSARVKTKGMVASALAHSYDCTVEPLCRVDGLLPGMVCKVYLATDSRSGIVIPSSVVQMDAAGRYVWLVSDSVVVKRYVEIDGFSGKGVVVTSGLEQGESLIVEGSRKVSTGMKVKVQE